MTVAEFRRFVKATGYVTFAERPLDPADYPDADPDAPRARLAGVPPHARAGAARRRPHWWAYVPGAELASPRGTRQRRSTAASATRSSTSPARTRRPTPPGPARSCRPRPSGSTPPGAGSRARLRLGRRGRAARPDDGQHLAGRVPVAEPAARRVERHVAGRAVPAERLRALRHGRQRLGVDDRLRTRPPPRRAAHACCAPHNPRVNSPDASYEPASPASTSRAASSRAARTSARPTTACATGPPPVRRGRSTPRPGHIGFRCVVRPGLSPSGEAASSIRRCLPAPVRDAGWRHPPALRGGAT